MLWDEDVYMIRRNQPMVAIGHRNVLTLMQDRDRVLDANICNLSRPDGLVCRHLKGHDGPHIPFAGEHICAVGIYVAAIEPVVPLPGDVVDP